MKLNTSNTSILVNAFIYHFLLIVFAAYYIKAANSAGCTSIISLQCSMIFHGQMDFILQLQIMCSTIALTPPPYLTVDQVCFHPRLTPFPHHAKIHYEYCRWTTSICQQPLRPL